MFPKNLSRVVVCHGTVDFRKHWNGLLGEAQRLGFSPYDGDMVVFVKRDKRQLRGICGDDKGLYLFCRRFEGGCFNFVFSGDTKEISLRELEQWFSGAQLVRKEIPSWR